MLDSEKTVVKLGKNIRNSNYNNTNQRLKGLKPDLKEKNNSNKKGTL